MKRRNVMAVIFLSIITFGIYDLFWLVKVKKELNAKTNVRTPSMWLLTAPYILFIVGTIIAIAISSANINSAEDPSAVSSIAILISYIVATVTILPITVYWFYKFSKAVSQYTNKELNTAVTFLLLWMLRFIGIAILQDHFNDMLEATSGTSPTTSGVAPNIPTGPTAPTWQTPNQDPIIQSEQPFTHPQYQQQPQMSQPPVPPQTPTPPQPPTPPSS